MSALTSAMALVLLTLMLLQDEALAEPAADAGALRASVESDPWSLELTDAKGRSVLAEHPGIGSGPTGTLGIRTSSGWQHATRVIEARREGGGLRRRAGDKRPGAGAIGATRARRRGRDRPGRASDRLGGRR